MLDVIVSIRRQHLARFQGHLGLSRLTYGNPKGVWEEFNGRSASVFSEMGAHIHFAQFRPQLTTARDIRVLNVQRSSTALGHSQSAVLM